MSTVMGTTSNSNVIDVEVYARGENGVGIDSSKIEYQAGSSSTTVPTGTWSTSFVTPSQGQFLWTRITFTYTNGQTAVSYTISYFPTDGLDGGYYTPAVAANGDLSWTPSDPSLPSVQTVNIKGPQGEMGSVKFYYVNALPTTNIENDAFYVMDASSPTSYKYYDEYFYINNHWEKIGEDLNAYYNKTQIDSLFENFVAQLIKINSAAANTTYYAIGADGTGNKSLYKTKIGYYEDSNGNGTGTIDGNPITTGLFYSIS